jgi:hypothetical protein
MMVGRLTLMFMSHPDVDQGAQHVAGGLDHLGGGAGMQLGHLEIDQFIRHLYLITRRGVEAGDLAGRLTGQLLGPLESCTPVVMARSIRIGTLL